MRIAEWLIVLFGSFFIAGCNQRPTPVVDGGTSAASTPVGPIPGAIQQSASYAKDPLATDPVALQDGRRLFNWYNCSGCHGGHAGGGMGPSLRDPVWLYGNRDDQIYDSIAQGRSQGMPAWGSKIPQLQIWELVTYIKSLDTPDEPDPPVEPADETVFNPVTTTSVSGATETQSASLQEHK